MTEGALRLQAAGLISYARGHISVLDREGLEQRTCECYAVVKKEYDRLLPEERSTQSRHVALRALTAWADEAVARASPREVATASAN